jgi:hypothetical protein
MDFTAAIISGRALFNALGFGPTIAQLDLAVCTSQTGSHKCPQNVPRSDRTAKFL